MVPVHLVGVQPKTPPKASAAGKSSAAAKAPAKAAPEAKEEEAEEKVTKVNWSLMVNSGGGPGRGHGSDAWQTLKGYRSDDVGVGSWTFRFGSGTYQAQVQGGNGNSPSCSRL